MDLPAQELRVLGCLVEKQLTTPQQYPLTLNALTLACNQSSNRFPVVSYDERTVEGAVTSAKTRGLARFVHPSHGRSAIRFAHTLDEVLGLDGRQLALLAVLMLRGPQTPGELRSRTERMASFDDLAAVERDLGLLAERSEPLVVRLRRGPGQKEDRFAHLLGSSARESEDPETPARAGRPAGPGPEGSVVTEGSGPESSVVTKGATLAFGAEPSSSASPSAGRTLEEALSELRAEVTELRRQLEELRAELGA